MTDADDLRQRAISVLDANRMEGWTKPEPQLYPLQWSWDSAFVAVGLARIDPDRATEEMRSRFRAQWRNGMISHIVFNPAIAPGDYFSGPERWVRDVVAPDTLSGVRTSLVQVRESGFAEYVEPFTGEPLGSLDQSWTAAITLGWMVDDARE